MLHRLGIKPFAELGANSEALSGSQVDSPCSCRAIFESAPVAMLQSLKFYRNSAVKYLFGGRARGNRMVEVTANIVDPKRWTTQATCIC